MNKQTLEKQQASLTATAHLAHGTLPATSTKGIAVETDVQAGEPISMGITFAMVGVMMAWALAEGRN